MRELISLSADDLKIFNRCFKEDSKVLQEDSIESAVAYPFQSFNGEDLFPSIFDKAAVLFRCILFGHPFVDGNKRTALHALNVFLLINGYLFCPVSSESKADFVIRAVKKHMSVHDISKYLEENTVEVKAKEREDK